LNDKGKQLLAELEEADVEEQDSLVYDWLLSYYKNAGKEIGNRKKTLSHIKDFRVKSGICKNNLIKLCIDFLKENEERSNKLQFVFYYPKTVFATRFDLEESWLYSHYLKKEEYFKSIFEDY
jgi:tryptophanyl-tRNA synthetase